MLDGGAVSEPRVGGESFHLSLDIDCFSPEATQGRRAVPKLVDVQVRNNLDLVFPLLQTGQ